MSTHNMAQTLIDNALEHTNLSLGQVANTINTHGDLILSRWSKKSKNKNRDVLGAANNLPSWLQIEDLIEDRMKLISLLHVRTTFSSEHWTTFDAVESEASFGQENESSSHSSDYVLICGANFGRVVGFELGAAQNRTMFAFPHALYIFRKQNELADALLTIVNNIMAGAAQSGNEKWLALVSTGLYGTGGRLDSYQDAAFVPPVNGLNTEALLQASLDKRDQMADEVELLQTDPEYTSDHVLALKADIRWDANVSSDLKWEHVAGRFATEAIAELNVWNDIALTCEELRDACQVHENVTTFLPSEVLHPEYVFPILAELRQLLYDSQRFQWEELYTAITQMHAAKDLYRMCSAGGKLVPCRRIIPPGAPSTPSDRIHKAFCDLATAMNARYTSKTPQFNELLKQLSAVQFDQRADKCLSTLIQLDALQLCVDWCQTPPPPWYSAEFFTHESFAASQSPSEDFFVEKRHAEIDPSRRESYEILTSGQPHPKWKPLGPLLRAVCENPLPKSQRGSPGWLAKADEARRHLMVFWQTLRQIMVVDRKRRAPTDQRYPALLRDFFSFDVATEYLAGVEAEREEIEAEEDVAAATQAKEATQTADAQQTTWGEEGGASNEQPAMEKAAELKAPGLTSEEELELLQVGFDAVQIADPVEEAPAVPAKVHIAVKANSLALLRKMFNSAGSTSVRWDHMVQAMTDAGMTVTQNPGSGVKFRYGLRSVVIDKPHPEPVVSSRLLRRSVGKRLTKWFKWDAETFVLRERKQEQEQEEPDVAE
jgi:hypothetical protein